jgi:hypothetical protein
MYSEPREASSLSENGGTGARRIAEADHQAARLQAVERAMKVSLPTES